MLGHPLDRRLDGRRRRTGPAARSQGRVARLGDSRDRPNPGSGAGVRIWVGAAPVGRGRRRGAGPRRIGGIPRATHGRLCRQRRPSRPNRRQTNAGGRGLWARSDPVRCPSALRPSLARAWRPDRPRRGAGTRAGRGYWQAMDQPRAQRPQGPTGERRPRRRPRKNSGGGRPATGCAAPAAPRGRQRRARGGGGCRGGCERAVVLCRTGSPRAPPQSRSPLPASAVRRFGAGATFGPCRPPCLRGRQARSPWPSRLPSSL